jgi:hypothetical protein
VSGVEASGGLVASAAAQGRSGRLTVVTVGHKSISVENRPLTKNTTWSIATPSRQSRLPP